MKTDENEKMETINRLASTCLTGLIPDDRKGCMQKVEIKVFDYYELASIIRNLMKLCIIALDQDAAELPDTIKNRSIDVGLILGIALQLFPTDEFELLNEIRTLFPSDDGNKDAEIASK